MLPRSRSDPSMEVVGLALHAGCWPRTSSLLDSRPSAQLQGRFLAVRCPALMVCEDQTNGTLESLHLVITPGVFPLVSREVRST